MTLLDLVDALTLPSTENVRQAADDGTYIKTVPVTHKPLLVQFADSVLPGSEKASGSSSLASTRNVLDASVLFEYTKMATAIGDWCRIAQVTPVRDPVKDLRAWYVVYSQYAHDSSFYEGQLRSWIGTIRGHLDPPQRIEAGYPCPSCGPNPWVDEDGEKVPNMLIIEYRKEKPTAGRTICRNPDCALTWDGIEAMEELGEELRERHANTV